MFFINVANPWVVLLLVFLVMCVLYIGKQAKNAYVPLMALIIFAILLVMHTMQYLSLPVQYETMAPQLGWCMAIDFIFVFLTYISYLWIDDIETKAKKKKSIDNSLEWFWKNV